MTDRAEIAHFKQEEREAYEDSLKYYRDMKNSLDTAKEDGKVEVAQALIAAGDGNEKISQVTGLSIERVLELRKNS